MKLKEEVTGYGPGRSQEKWEVNISKIDCVKFSEN